MATPIEVHYQDGFRTHCEHPSGKSVIDTQTHLPEGQAAQSYNPVELLTIAASACAMSMIAVAGERHNFEVKDMKCFATMEMERHPTRVSALNIEIHLKDMGYDEKQRKIIERAVYPCPVTASLSEEVKKNITFIFE